ncbi:hypothetical protein RJ641_029767 [Dillenia turbinata]|uniref:DUF7870 domain-containing protein n=1 Tax=Dillenia turbinata TaxID=194707 RepID=A0AAN8W1Z5_9MAGN
MEVERIQELLSLWSRLHSNRVALVGGNHTAARWSNGLRLKRMAKHLCGDCDGLPFDSETHHFLIIRLPDMRFLKAIAGSMLLALCIVSLPRFGTVLGAFLDSNLAFFNEAVANNDWMDIAALPMMFHDLSNEGLLKMGDRTLFLSSGYEDAVYGTQVLNENQIDLINDFDTNRQGSIPDNTFDFAFSFGFNAAREFIDRTLKIGGILAIQLSNDPGMAFEKPSNYKIIYLRRFDSTLVAMRKTVYSDSNSPTKRKLLGFVPEAKKAALKGLEDVLLEPPRASSGKSSRYLKKTKYLPDLLGDNLESYPRRVFIDVGLREKEGGDGTGWFAKNYPTRNKNFEIYKIEAVTEEASGKEVPNIGMSDWLRKNVKDEEYVVMKAEAEVVEEMMKSKATSLVDELFLECKHNGLKKKGNKSRRAYWECLALYGRLRDEGVAVHQWWG